MLVEVWFYANSSRKNGPPHGSAYRPHLVVAGSTQYLGVQFTNLPQRPCGERIPCEIRLLYPGVDAARLTPGAAFSIREGPHTVGAGVVLAL